MSLSFGPYNFKDSCLLLNGSLASLVRQAASDGYEFPLLDKFRYGKLNGKEHKHLCLAKSVFPYDTTVSVEQLRSAKEFPPIEQFYSVLTRSGITKEDYETAKELYKLMGATSMLSFCHFYCALDTILLASVMAYRRRICYREYSLDLAAHISGPQFAMSCLLQSLNGKYQIELITCPEMHRFFESAIRGGVAFAGLRYDCVEEPYDENVRKTLAHLDATNLYGFSLSQNLPIGGFRWMTEDELNSFDWRKEENFNSDQAALLCVDLEYPEELHDAHSALPMAPTFYSVSDEELSPHARYCLKKWGKINAEDKLCGQYAKQKRLGGTFHKRLRYIVYSPLLAFYCRHGLKVTKIHSGVTFRTAPFIRDYVSHMSAKRAQAKSVVERTLYKNLVR